MKKVLKIIGIALLVMALCHASNWDLPQADSDYEQALAEYNKLKNTWIVIEGEEYEGMVINGLYYEPLELWQGSLPISVMESEGEQ